MKKLILLAIAFIAFQTSFAQSSFKKSDKIIEGALSYEKSKDADATYTFAPTVGYFLTDKTAIGVTLETGKDDTGKSHSRVGVFARHYFLNVGQNFKVYSQLGVLNNNNADTKAYISADFGLGLNYFVTTNLALTTSLTSLASYDDSTSTIKLGVGNVENPFNAPKFGILYRF